jgi:hypothetical protein
MSIFEINPKLNELQKKKKKNYVLYKYAKKHKTYVSSVGVSYI